MRERFLGDETRLRERDDRLAAAIDEREPLMLWFDADLFDVLLLVRSSKGCRRGTLGGERGALAGRHAHPGRAFPVTMGHRQH